LAEDGRLGWNPGGSEERPPEDLDLAVPPTIAALLTARLDRLPSDERDVLAAASVIGQTFYPAAVAELSQRTLPEVNEALLTLTRRGLARSAATDLAGEAAAAFDHVLVRDAAYTSLAKRVRVDLHVTFARWLERRTQGTTYDDLVGGHLETACHLRADLGPLDDIARGLAVEAGERLTAAGQLMLGADDQAAIALLRRALALNAEPSTRRRSIEVILSIGLLRTGPLPEAARMAADVVRSAQADGDAQSLARGRLVVAQARQASSSEGAAERLRVEADRALVICGDLEDHLGLGLAHLAKAEVAALRCRLDALAAETRLTVDHLERAGFTRWAQACTNWLLVGLMAGKRPAAPGLDECRRIATTSDGRVPRMYAWVAVAYFARLLGLTEEQREAVDHAEQLRAELQTADADRAFVLFTACAALACGQAREAALLFQRDCASQELSGDVARLATASAYQAHALLALGDRPGAERQAQRALDLCSTDDILTRALGHSALGWVAAASGAAPNAVRDRVETALAAVQPTELLLDQALVHIAAAASYHSLGNERDALQHRATAIGLYDAKGNVVGAERLRSTRDTYGVPPRSARG
jgi:hypothetical protein